MCESSILKSSRGFPLCSPTMGIPLALARDYFLKKMQTRQTSGAACP